jgi:hypothetical protein
MSQDAGAVPTNVLSFGIPGFDPTLFVQFPVSRLPVCDTCKRLFKTREICRVRSKHSDPPWTPVYICLSLDGSCTDPSGKLVNNKPLVCRLAQSRQYCAPVGFFAQKDNPPVCSTCKKANRAKKTCRGRYGHCQLPWSTVYAVLSTEESADPTTVIAPPSRHSEGLSSLNHPAEDMSMSKTRSFSPYLPPAHFQSQPKESTNPPMKGLGDRVDIEMDHRGRTVESPFVDEAVIVSKVSLESPASDRSEDVIGGRSRRDAVAGDSLYPISDTRTLLLTVSSRSTTITWLTPQPGTHQTDVNPLLLSATNRHSTTMQQIIPTSDIHPYPLSQHPYPLATSADAAAAAAQMSVVDICMGIQEQHHGALRRSNHHHQQQLLLVNQEDLQQYGRPIRPSSLDHQAASMLGADESSVTLLPEQKIPVVSQSRVTAGEAAAAIAAQRERRKQDPQAPQIGPPTSDPPLILPHLQHQDAIHLTGVAFRPDLGYPSAWRFQNVPMLQPAQTYPFAQTTSGYHAATQASSVGTMDINDPERTDQYTFNVRNNQPHGLDDHTTTTSPLQAGDTVNSTSRGDNSFSSHFYYQNTNETSASVPEGECQTSEQGQESEEGKPSMKNHQPRCKDEGLPKRQRVD